MSSLPQRFPNLLTLRVELQRLPERVSCAFIVLVILREYQYHEREIYTSGKNEFDCKGQINKELHLHETQGCAFTIPGLGPTGPYHSALSRFFQSLIPIFHTQPAEALVGKYGGVKWVYVSYLHLQ
jgi:hypothetical protein